jgi:HD-GYP domain-containing protein (c-di-GMP phosphodiesterase class II)
MTSWPDDFNFKTDKICQTVFKPFILSQLEALKVLDAQRPPGTTYLFHPHSMRVAKDVQKTCRHLYLSRRAADNIYWALLPHDIGKTLLPVEVWDVDEKPGEDLKTLRRSHTNLGVEIAEKALKGIDHPFKTLMLDIMANHHEQIDGKGYHGLKAEQLSPSVRLAAIVEAFDGWSIPRPHFGNRDITPPAVLERMRTEKAGMFDPGLFAAFAEMKLKDYNKTS